MTSWHKIICNGLSLACFVFVTGLPAALLAEDPPPAPDPNQQTADAQPLAIKGSASTFEYQIEGRPDPFLPFVSERSTTTSDNPNEIVEEDQVLTGMQLFEPGQLTLVALMIGERTKFAMVQDFTGKGYIIKEGMKIGRRGVVSEIGDNKVVISETARTRGGKTLTNQIAMVLKKEGEE